MEKGVDRKGVCEEVGSVRNDGVKGSERRRIRWEDEEVTIMQNLDKMVRKFAWETLRKLPGAIPMWELDDLIQTGWEVVFRAKAKYDPSRSESKFSTYVQKSLHSASSNILRDAYRRPSIGSETACKTLEHVPEGVAEGLLSTALKKLRKGAKETLEALMLNTESPTIAEVTRVTGKARKTVAKHFQQIRETVGAVGGFNIYKPPYTPINLHDKEVEDATLKAAEDARKAKNESQPSTDRNNAFAGKINGGSN